MTSGSAGNGGVQLKNGRCMMWASAPKPKAGAGVAGQAAGGVRHCGNGGLDNMDPYYRTGRAIPCTPLCLCSAECRAPRVQHGTATNGGVPLEDGICKHYSSRSHNGNRYCGNGSPVTNVANYQFYANDGGIDCAPLCVCPEACQAPTVVKGGSSGGGSVYAVTK